MPDLKLDISPVFIEAVGRSITRVFPKILACLVFALAGSTATGAAPEYTAAEAKKHIGETARVTDKVGRALGNRHGGYNLGMGGCDALVGNLTRPTQPDVLQLAYYFGFCLS